LNKHKTTLISGKNGAGKTTVLSAICFGLFGRGHGNINKPALINSINQKQLVVELTFTIGKKNYKIIRGMKPNIFEIYENDKLVNQDPSVRDYQKILEQKILKFNYRAFTQVIAVGGGSDYTSFMRLSTKDRREFVEDLMDIRVFSVMNSVVKEDNKLTKEELHDIIALLASVKEKTALQESFIKKLKKEKQTSADKVINALSQLQEKNRELNEQLEELMLSFAACEIKVKEHTALDKSLSEIRVINKQMKFQLDKKKEKQSFYESLDVCPTCSQHVSDEHKDVIVSEFTGEITSLLGAMTTQDTEEQKLRDLIDSYTISLDLYSEIQRKISEIGQEIFSNTMLVRSANNQLSDMESNTSNIDDEILKLKDFAKEYLACDDKKKELLTTLQYQDYIQQILSDTGIKSKIIKQYIPTINRLINKFLSELDFFCNFFLDESFTETIKSRHRDTFTYDHFSEGQKRRIDLAVLLTWMEIAKAKNSINTNISFFDEMDAPLDASGADLFLNTIKSSTSDNIFLISHKADLLIDKCDNSISFDIVNNFTEIVTA